MDQPSVEAAPAPQQAPVELPTAEEDSEKPKGLSEPCSARDGESWMRASPDTSAPTMPMAMPALSGNDHMHCFCEAYTAGV